MIDSYMKLNEVHKVVCVLSSLMALLVLHKGRKIVTFFEHIVLMVMILRGGSLYNWISVRLILSKLYVNTNNQKIFYRLIEGLHSIIETGVWSIHSINLHTLRRKQQRVIDDPNYRLIHLRDTDVDVSFELYPIAETVRSHHGYSIPVGHVNDNNFNLHQQLALSGKCHDWAQEFARSISSSLYNTYFAILPFRWTFWLITLVSGLLILCGGSIEFAEVLIMLQMIFDISNQNHDENVITNMKKKRTRSAVIEYMILVVLLLCMVSFEIEGRVISVGKMTLIISINFLPYLQNIKLLHILSMVIMGLIIFW